MAPEQSTHEAAAPSGPGGPDWDFGGADSTEPVVPPQRVSHWWSPLRVRVLIGLGVLLLASGAWWVEAGQARSEPSRPHTRLGTLPVPARPPDLLLPLPPTRDPQIDRLREQVDRLEQERAAERARRQHEAAMDAMRQLGGR
jgi:hypothetical protein